MTTAFGNASSIDHTYGDEAEEAVSQAAVHIAKLIGASPKEVIFTSGATESINLAIQGIIPFEASSKTKHRIAVLPVEHKAVLDTCYALAKKGLAEIITLRVDSKGRLDLDHLEQVCTNGVSLLCVMAANNEVGNIYPLKEIGQIAQKYDIPLLCDASQAVGKIPIDFNVVCFVHRLKTARRTLRGYEAMNMKRIGSPFLIYVAASSSLWANKQSSKLNASSSKKLARAISTTASSEQFKSVDFSMRASFT